MTAAVPPDRPGAPPAPLTPLVGRDREAAAVLGLLRRSGARLVTLTGPGGVGKTRLALRVAAELASAYADGVAFVPLATIRDPDLVASVVAHALDVRETGDRPLAERLRAFLRGRELLLVLDNFEQVVAAAPLLADLLTASPRLAALVTSRAALRLSGERRFTVPPLALPDLGGTPSPAALAGNEAVRLFVARAGAVRPDFALTEANAAAVAAICARLDGLPLAIELAAARSDLIPPHALLARLERRLPVLDRGAPDLPPRHRSLRDAVAWSHDLLDEPERALFRRLAVFVGGFSLEAAERVAGNEERDPGAEPGEDGPTAAPSSPVAPSPSTLDLLGSLVAKSLILPEPAADGGPDADLPRFVLLETIREFALEQLAASGEEEAVRRAHAAYFLELAADARRRFEGPDRAAAREAVARDHDDLRAALGWAVARGEAETAQRLAGALAPIWVVLGSVGEGRQWLDRAAALPGAAPATRAEALCWAAQFAALQNAPERAAALAGEALALARAGGDRRGVALALHEVGQAAHWRGDLDGAVARYEAALALFREVGEPVREGIALRHLGIAADQRGDAVQAERYHRAALAVWRRLDHRWGVPAALRDLAHLALHRGDSAAALPLYRESLEGWRRLGERLHVAECFWGLARIALAAGQADEAARLLGAADALHEAVGAVPPPNVSEELAYAAGEARARLGDAGFAAAWNAGRALPPDEVLAEAAEIAAAVPTVPSAGETPTDATSADRWGMTARELEVLRLLVEGHSDREIAAALVISHRTVNAHVARILGKFGVDARAAAAALAVRHGLV